MGDVTHIDDYRPHLQTGDPVTRVRFVMPVENLKGMAEGKLPIDDEPMVRALIFMLYEELCENCDLA